MSVGTQSSRASSLRPGEEKHLSFLDFLRSLHCPPLGIPIRDFALFYKKLTVSGWFMYKREAK